MSSLDVIVPQEITPDEAHTFLATGLAPRYAVDRVPGRDDQLYVSRPPWTYILVKVKPLPDDRTSLRVSADGFAHPYQWLYGRLIGSKRVARAIAETLD
ncbi:MAG TPA: hypothetical protein VGG41_05305 [Solirubrobacteraceae bacterium]